MHLSTLIFQRLLNQVSKDHLISTIAQRSEIKPRVNSQGSCSRQCQIYSMGLVFAPLIIMQEG